MLTALVLAGVPLRAQETSSPTPAPTPEITEEVATAASSAATTAVAGERQVSTLANPEPPPSNVPVADNAIHLSLDDAVTTALRRNLGLLVERYDRQQFHLRIAEALGIYDVGLGGQGYATSETSPSTSRQAGAGQVITTKDRNINLFGDQLTPWGGVGTLTFNLFRRESNSRDLVLNPFFVNDLDLSLVQPLLRNLGRATTEHGIRVAHLNSGISRETFETQVASTLQQVENAYWNLVQAIRDVEVAKESLGLAQELHRMNKVRVDVGTLAPLELVQSEVGIATREEGIITAQAAKDNAEDTLRQLLHLEDGELWNLPIVPTTAPETPPTEIDLAQAIATAMTDRAELHSQKLQLDLRQLDVAFFRNQARPRLDLTARYGYNGIGGTIRNPTTGEIIATGSASDAIRQVRQRDFNGWRLQLDFAYPLQNRTARARVAIADVNLEQGKTQMTQLEETVRTEVRRAVRGVRTAAQEIQSAGASTRLAEQNLDAERKRYENGLSTSFQVLQIQEDLTAARSRQVAAIAGYRRALAEYYRATGRLLAAEGVELDDPLRVDHLDRYGWGVGAR
ncbi:MAG TPA: TolC family protein [Thermoanaerobaculia bacterium]|nr:TolC family protein [Thermoanaerobaculia bacterium]